MLVTADVASAGVAITMAAAISEARNNKAERDKAKMSAWESDGYDTHPSKAEEQEALSCSSTSNDCARLAWSIDVLTRQMKYRRWDAQRSRNSGYASHKQYYNNTVRPKLQALVNRAKTIGCPYNPEADQELKKSFDYRTNSY